LSVPNLFTLAALCVDQCPETEHHQLRPPGGPRTSDSCRPACSHIIITTVAVGVAAACCCLSPVAINAAQQQQRQWLKPLLQPDAHSFLRAAHAHVPESPPRVLS